MTRIIDNNTLTLSDSLKNALPHSKRLDACVGYFNLRGWREIRTQANSMLENHLEGGPRVRLLVGMALSGEDQARVKYDILKASEDLSVMDMTQIAPRRLKSLESFSNQLMWGVPNTGEQVGLQELLQDLKSGFLQVKFHAAQPLHAKLYVSHLAAGPSPFQAVVGSSNFTPSGLMQNGELNLEETDREQAEELAKWFKLKWEDPYSVDLTDDLISILENSWVNNEQPKPRAIHLRLAYELSREARSGKTLDIPKKLLDEMMPWQEDAVRIATRILEQRGLVVLGDVVGLGKTLAGTAIAATFDESVLILCPKNLEKMWNDYKDTYGVPGRVLPLSQAINDLPDMRPYKLVLIDESHNLKNSDGKIWERIREYIATYEPKLILLTATMYSAGTSDITGQLGLKITDDLDLGIRPEDYISSLPLGEVDLAQRNEGHLSNLRAFSLSPIASDWQRLLSMFLVRRTREYIKDKYGTIDPATGEVYFTFRNGTRFSFPKRVALPLEYEGGDSDPGDLLACEENFDILYKLSFARYALSGYLSKVEDFASEKDKTLYEDLKKNNAVTGFIRTTLLKRLASSPKAFFITVEKMLLRSWVTLYALEKGLEIPVGTIADSAYKVEETDDPEFDFDDLSDSESAIIDGSWAQGLDYDQWMSKAKSAYERLTSKGVRNLRWARLEWFDKAKLQNAISGDVEKLQAIIDVHGAWDVTRDSRLIALAELIAEKRSLNEKVLVFSEYRDTIEYVSRHLPNLVPGVKIGTVSGATEDATKYARMFSPISNESLGGLPDGEVEIDVLLSTDVLSEGQNLQDGSNVVNWDMPWTIIKIIQRAGRVDRIGQQSPSVNIYSFLPHDGVEKVLQLIKALRRRLNENEMILGGSEEFLKNQIQADSQFAGLFNGAAILEGPEGDVDYGSYALRVWDEATEPERDSALKLTPGSFSTLGAEDLRGEGVLTHAKAVHINQGELDYLAWVGSNGSVRALTQLEAMRATAATPGTLPLQMLDNHFSSVSKALEEIIIPQARVKHTIANYGIRRQLYELLTKGRDEHFSQDDLFEANTHQTIEAMCSEALQHPIVESSKSKIAELLRFKKRLGEKQVLIALVEMFDDGKLFDSSTSEISNLTVMLSMGYRANE
jgi:superfamily II DNA or RNA helicase